MISVWQPGEAEEDSRLREGNRHLHLAYDEEERRRRQTKVHETWKVTQLDLLCQKIVNKDVNFVHMIHNKPYKDLVKGIWTKYRGAGIGHW